MLFFINYHCMNIFICIYIPKHYLFCLYNVCLMLPVSCFQVDPLELAKQLVCSALRETTYPISRLPRLSIDFCHVLSLSTSACLLGLSLYRLHLVSHGGGTLRVFLLCH